MLDTALERIGYGLVTFANGVTGLLGALVSPLTLGIVIGSVCLAWLALCEIEEMDRQGAKPEVGRH
jgi:integral membrane sensor domain MASE1